MTPPIRGIVTALALCLVAGDALAQSASPAPETRPATGPAATQPVSLPHVTINREEGLVDLDATVVLREAEWIEQLACSPKTREHESILTIDARPSHVHLALVILGLQPGSPMRWWREGEEVKFARPHGPKVAVSVLYEEAGKRVEVKASEWIVNQKNKKPMESNLWLFAGSQIGEIEGKKVYHADLNGTVISLVNFGDDLLSRATETTNMNDDAEWGANTAKIPPLGTKVTLRLRTVKD